MKDAYLAGGNARPCCELAFGDASEQVCEDVMRDVNNSVAAMASSALRSAASSSTAKPASVGGPTGQSGCLQQEAQGACGWQLCSSGNTSGCNTSGDFTMNP